MPLTIFSESWSSIWNEWHRHTSETSAIRYCSFATTEGKGEDKSEQDARRERVRLSNPMRRNEPSYPQRWE
nr:MAG TPA: hypothetical protein [Caudoviricetes sp.]